MWLIHLATLMIGETCGLQEKSLRYLFSISPVWELWKTWYIQAFLFRHHNNRRLRFAKQRATGGSHDHLMSTNTQQNTGSQLSRFYPNWEPLAKWKSIFDLLTYSGEGQVSDMSGKDLSFSFKIMRVYLPKQEIQFGWWRNVWVHASIKPFGLNLQWSCKKILIFLKLTLCN